MSNFVMWANSNNGLLMVILTFLYLMATILIYTANRKAVKEMQESRIADSRPYVIAGIEICPNGPVEFILRNDGKTSAKNVIVKSEPEIQNSEDISRPISESYLFKSGVPCLIPNQEIRAVFSMAWHLPKDERPVYMILVTYTDNLNNHYSDEYICDLNLTKGLSFILDKNIKDIVKEINDVSKGINNLITCANTIARNIESIKK